MREVPGSNPGTHTDADGGMYNPAVSATVTIDHTLPADNSQQGSRIPRTMCVRRDNQRPVGGTLAETK
jgi:hypothetical protein